MPDRTSAAWSARSGNLRIIHRDNSPAKALFPQNIAGQAGISAIEATNYPWAQVRQPAGDLPPRWKLAGGWPELLDCRGWRQ